MYVRSISKFLLLILLACWCLPSHAAHTRAKLILSHEVARPGETIWAGLHLEMDPGWHTYWKNPGASGIATTAEWTLPAGMTAGEIRWPVPEKLDAGELTTYAYHDEVVLLVPIQIGSNSEPGLREIQVSVSWLECKELCLPGSADLSMSLMIGADSEASRHAETINHWQQQVPRPGDSLNPRGRWENDPQGSARSMLLEWAAPAGVERVDFYPFASDDFEVQPATKQLPSSSEVVRIRKQVRKFSEEWPSEVAGLLVHESGGQRIAFEATIPLMGQSNDVSQSIWKMLLYAFIGGMILNIMPCVLPVIALKILGFVTESRSDPRHVRKLGLIYAAGVLASFLALAGLTIGVQTAGRLAGWGMQFSNPYFLIVMTILVTLIALNFFGVYEVTIGGRALGAASAVSAKSGPAGAFFNGLLATVLATSCTAPALGTAVGYAILQPPGIIILVLLTVGAGLAFPYVVLSWKPAWLKLLPKPGPWMEKFKIAMGFPMLAAAVWLLSILAIFYSERTWWFAMFLVVLAVAAWLFGHLYQRHVRHRGWALAAAGLLIGTSYFYILEEQFRWREPVSASASGEDSRVPANLAPSGYEWEPWSLEAVEQARSEGRVVIVDFTAKWCINCQLNVKPTLASRAVREKLKELNAVALLADYTLRPDHMTQELRKFGRPGVPLVLIYPEDPSKPPVVLPETLTPGLVVGALAQAGAN